MSTDKSKKPTDTIMVRSDSMTTKHLMHQLTTSHLQSALKPPDNSKPVPSLKSSNDDKNSASTSKTNEK